MPVSFVTCPLNSLAQVGISVSVKGFNDGAIDTFAGNRLSSVVREIIQNSLDAKKNPEEPVRLCFRLDEVSKSDFDGFHGIEPHIKKCKEMAKEQQLDHVVAFYDRAIKAIKKRVNVPILSIHDYNTVGLTGPIDKPVGAWSALVKGAGITQKSSPDLWVLLVTVPKHLSPTVKYVLFFITPK